MGSYGFRPGAVPRARPPRLGQGEGPRNRRVDTGLGKSKNTSRMAEPKKSAPSGPKPATGPKPTASLRTEHAPMITRLNGLAERIETLHDLGTLAQLSLAREVLELVSKN